jgi:C-terminal processing protease CtpA/Prc
MRRSGLARGVVLSFSLIALLPFAGVSRAQQRMNSFDMDESRGMLRDALDAVKKYYYDPKYHGIDLEKRYREYDEKIKDAPSLNQGMRMVAAFLAGFNDSHLFFIPPPRPYRIDYGYRYQLVGNDAYIMRIRPGTDAESKIHPGDRIVFLNTYAINREDFDQLLYYFSALAPQPATALDLVDPSGATRHVTVDSKVREEKKVLDLTTSDGGNDLNQLNRRGEDEYHLLRERYVEAGDVMYWKMPEFILDQVLVERMFAIAHKHQTLILDLRSNPGGSIDTLEHLIGNVFDHDVKIADRVGRKEMNPQLAKTVGDGCFNGKIIVLVDSLSGSSSELFARVMQLEKRGTVIGDRTYGGVMEARHYPYSQGLDTKIFYGFSVTDADLIMKDGKSIEHTGVTPDEIVLPTGQDLAAGRDPVLARAAELAGAKLTPADAGKMFPFEWEPF